MNPAGPALQLCRSLMPAFLSPVSITVMTCSCLHITIKYRLAAVIGFRSCTVGVKGFRGVTEHRVSTVGLDEAVSHVNI